MSTSDSASAEHEALINRVIDREATDDERARLIDLVRADAIVRRTYVERVCFDTLLQESLGSENLLGLVDSVTDVTASKVAPAPPSPKRSISRRTILGIVVGLTSIAAVLLVGVGMVLLPALQSARPAARKSQSKNNLKQLALALHDHHAKIGTLPAAYNTDSAGKPLLSWRVHLLPYLDQNDLYERFHLDDPWDSDHNRTLIPLIPNIYRRPEGGLEPGHTCYLAIRHENSVLPPPPAADFGAIPPTGISLDQVANANQTIAIVEVDPDDAVVWSRPDDYLFNADAPTSGLGNNQREGFLALFLDGVVRLLPHDIDAQVLAGYFTRAAL